MIPSIPEYRNFSLKENLICTLKIAKLRDDWPSIFNESLPIKKPDDGCSNNLICVAHNKKIVTLFEHYNLLKLEGAREK